jgi:hypothetical protein
MKWLLVNILDSIKYNAIFNLENKYIMLKIRFLQLLNTRF